MKKRMVALAAAFLLLAGCGSTHAEPYDEADVTDLLEGGSFSETLEVVDSNIVCQLYGVDETLVSDCTAYLSTGATAEELVLFTLNDAAAAETVKAACEKRVADQITAYESYIPTEVAKLEDALISLRGSTVLLVVPADAEAAAQVVNG